MPTKQQVSVPREERTDQASQIDARLSEMKAAAVEDELPWADVSEQALRRFLSAHRQADRPMIVHLENGNLRAIWKADRDRHVGLQFSGTNEIVYVMTVRRSGADFVSQAAGRDDFDGVVAQLKVLGLYELVAA